MCRHRYRYVYGNDLQAEFKLEVVQIGPLNTRFPLDVANVEFDFNEAFHAVALADPEAALARAEDLQNENLRAQGLVEVGRAFLEKIPRKRAKLTAGQAVVR